MAFNMYMRERLAIRALRQVPCPFIDALAQRSNDLNEPPVQMQCNTRMASKLTPQTQTPHLLERFQFIVYHRQHDPPATKARLAFSGTRSGRPSAPAVPPFTPPDVSAVSTCDKARLSKTSPTASAALEACFLMSVHQLCIKMIPTISCRSHQEREREWMRRERMTTRTGQGAASIFARGGGGCKRFSVFSSVSEGGGESGGACFRGPCLRAGD